MLSSHSLYYVLNQTLLSCIPRYFRIGYVDNPSRYSREDSSASDDGGDSQSTSFMIGSGELLNQTATISNPASNSTSSQAAMIGNNFTNLKSTQSASSISTHMNSYER